MAGPDSPITFPVLLLFPPLLLIICDINEIDYFWKPVALAPFEPPLEPPTALPGGFCPLIIAPGCTIPPFNGVYEPPVTAVP
jgi:hypothetical protein